MTLTDRLDTLLRTAEAATPGPWRMYQEHHVVDPKGRIIPFENENQYFKAAFNPVVAKALVEAVKAAILTEKSFHEESHYLVDLRMTLAKLEAALGGRG